MIDMDSNRAAWEKASEKHWREYDDLLAQARDGSSLVETGYFLPSYLNDSYPANGAREYQWTLGHIVNEVVRAGLPITHLGEHPEPFWKMGDIEAAAWRGRLPNTFSLVAGPR